MRGEFVEVESARLYYYAAGTRGAGEPVVFLHGFPTSGHLWGDVVALMPPGHRLVVTDLLGYGRSDPPRTHGLALRAHAARVIGLLDALCIERACIVGHGVGGGIAQAAAIHWPQRVSRLALVNSVAFGDWMPREIRVARALMPLVRRLPTTWLLPIIRADLERGYYDALRASHSIARYQRPFSGDEGRRALLQHLTALDRHETAQLATRLCEIAAPTAVIWGEHDVFLPLTLGARLAAAIPGATFDIAPDTRHFAPEDAPRVIADVLTDLLSRRSSGARTADR